MTTKPLPVPDPAVSPDAGQFFHVVLLDRLDTCVEEGCDQPTRCAIAVNGKAIEPACTAHAHLWFADWMVGV